MLKVIWILSCIILANGQNLALSGVDYVDNSVPTPYEFSYTAPAVGGSSSHHESGDGNGRVTGSYTIDDEDGRSRIVEYVADEDGFRAAISTNEPGTANQNPADVSIASSADDGHGGTQVFTAPPAAPIAPPPPPPPANIVTPVRLTPRQPPPPLPVRPTLVPIQPALVPIQPALVPIQPTVVPAQPALIPPRRFIIEPAAAPFGAARLIPRATLLPFDARRFAEPTVLVPIDDARLVPDPFFGRSFFRDFDRNIII